MFNGKYISIKSVLARIANYPFMDGLSQEDVALYLSEFLRKVGAPVAFVDKLKTIDITNSRGDLPKDLLYIRGSRVFCNGLVSSVDCADKCKDGFIALRYASDIYHSSYHCSDTLDTCDTNYDFTYSLNGGFIYTSFNTGQIQMSYKGLLLDEDGYPMIPDDVKVLEALKYYILWQYAEPSYFRKDIPKDIFQEIKQQYYFYVGAAQNSLNMPSPDQMKTLENGLIRMIRNTDWHEQGWKNFSYDERMTGVNRNSGANKGSVSNEYD